MITVTMTEAKKNFFELAERVQKGETVTLTFGRWKKPVARLVAISPVEAAELREQIQREEDGFKP